MRIGGSESNWSDLQAAWRSAVAQGASGVEVSLLVDGRTGAEIVKSKRREDRLADGLARVT